MHTSLPPASEATQPVTLPVVVPASLSAHEQQAHLIRELDRLNAQTDELLQKQPRPGGVYQQQLAAIFPDAPRPIDPNQIFYSRYQLDQAEQLQLLSCEPLGSLIKRLREADAPASQETGAFYRECNTLDADKRLVSIGSIATLTNAPAIAITLSLNTFWTKGQDAQPNPQEQLVFLRRQVLAHQLALGTVDGTLSPAGRALADNVLKYPSAPGREQVFTAANRPMVYRLTLKDGSEFAGAFILSSAGTTALAGKVMLYSPSEGFEEYASLETLNETVVARIREGLLAGKLLIASLPNAARAVLSDAPELAEQPAQIIADVIIDSVHSLRVRQFHATRNTLRNETLPSAGELDLSADLAPQLDVSHALAARNLRLLEADPVWLKLAEPQEQVQYRELEQALLDSHQALTPLLENIATLQAFSQQETETVLKRQKPAFTNVEIAPYRSLVHLRVSNSRTAEVTGYRDEETAAVYISQDPKIHIPEYLAQRKLTWGTWKTQVAVDLRTLESYARRNLDPWSVHDIHRTISATANIFDTAGKKWGALDNTDLRALAQEADIGQKYAAYLRSAFSESGTGSTFATAWQRACAAQMNKDALETRLNPAAHTLFTFQTPGSGFDWIKAINEHPDSSTRPRVSGFEIEVNLLVLGGAQARGQGGQVINRVLVIHRKGTRPDGVSVLYTPEAPDDVPFRELANGLAQLDALKAKPEWKAYFIQRMATNDALEITRIFNDTRGVHRYALTPITGNFLAYLYSAQLGFQLSHADFRSRSNAEISLESTVNAFMFGVETADFLLGLIPAKTAQALLRRSINRGLGLARQLGHRIPGLVKKTGVEQKTSVALAGAAIRPLEPAWLDVAAYRLPVRIEPLFDLPAFAQAHHYKLSRPVGSAPCFFDKHNNQLIAMRDETGRYHLFQSYVEDGARYVKAPAGNRPDFMVVPGDAKSWKPRFERHTRGGGSVLGSLRSLTPEQQVDADLIAALGVYASEADMRVCEEIIKKMSQHQKRQLLSNARQYASRPLDEAEFRRRLSDPDNLNPRTKNELRNALLTLRIELDIYNELNLSTRIWTPPLSDSNKDQLFKKIKKIIGKNENFSKEILSTIGVLDPDTGAQFLGFTVTKKQERALDVFVNKYKLDTWQEDSINAFLDEGDRYSVVERYASRNQITLETALIQFLSDSDIKKDLALFRIKFLKKKLEDLNVASYADDFKQTRTPYIVISRGNQQSPDAPAQMVDSTAIAKFESGLSQFSTPLEFDTPRVQTHRVDRPPTRPAPPAVPEPIPTRDPAVNIVRLDELAETQKTLLPDPARAKLEEIIQDIEAGRVSRKKIGNFTYVDLPQVQAGAGRGLWRVAIEKAGKEDAKDIFILRGIYDYHASKPVAWGV